MSPPPEAKAEVFEMASMKRQIALLQEEIDRSHGSKKKTSPDQSLARGASRLVSMFEPLQVLVAEFDRRLAASTAGVANDEMNPASLREQDRRYSSYKILTSLLPKFEAQLMDPDVEATNLYVASIQKAANEARGDDIRRVKEELACWLNDACSSEAGYQPFNPKHRDNRGLQNNITGRLLCPIEHDWRNEAIRSGIRDCAEGFDIEDNYFIGCLYPDKFRDLTDVLNLEEDFLRGHLLRKAFAVIFKSPSSAESITSDAGADDNPSAPKKAKNKKATKSNVATLLNMDGKVTPRSIAYVSTLLVFNLSDAPQWPSDGVYNGFDYHAFYNFIIDYFEVSDESDKESKAEVRALLLWWSKSMFPCHAKTKKGIDVAWTQLIKNRARRQRARKEAAQAAAAAGVSAPIGVSTSSTAPATGAAAMAGLGAAGPAGLGAV